MIYGINNGVLCRNVLDIEKFIKSVNPNRIYLDVDGVIFHSCQIKNKLIEYCGALKDVSGWRNW